MLFLKNINIKFRYRSGRDDLLNDFFIPCLKSAVKYQRAAGFFSASALIVLSRGVSGLLRNNGSMQLVISPVLSEQDIEAITNGYDMRKVIEESCSREIDKLQMSSFSSGVEALSWLIAMGKLDIKIAIPHLLDVRALYHEKIGVIQDANGDYVTFSGSINESETALRRNFESFDVDLSWMDFKGLADEKQKEFIDLWENKTVGVDVFEFPDAIKNSLLQLRKYDSIDMFLAESEENNHISEVNDCSTVAYKAIPIIPKNITLRPYQVKAIKAWFAKNCRGTYKMATGSGKTITALASIVKFLEWQKQRSRSTIIIIVCPYKHLISQWAKESDVFNINPICCFEMRDSWLAMAQAAVISANMGKLNHVCLLTTNTTFSLPPFQHLLNQMSADLLFIVDEVHNIGSERGLKLLPEQAQFRLALSATPERWFDDTGTEKLFSYFGEKVIEFTLSEAIQNEFLTKYYYYPHLIEFTVDEAYNYIDISTKVAPLIARQMNGEVLTTTETTILSQLLIKRARLCGSAYNKTEKLFQLMRKYNDQSHMLIYCGDGRVGDESDYCESIRQIELVVKTLGLKMNMHLHPFTAYEPLKLRSQLLERFEKEDLQALVAIRCLDEGVDIPAIKTAFILASSTNPRQFIQRRGRLLRRSKGKEFAVIHDFIMIPPGHENPMGEYYNIERRLLKKELARINEFANLAINGPEAIGVLRELKVKYHLLDI